MSFRAYLHVSHRTSGIGRPVLVSAVLAVVFLAHPAPAAGQQSPAEFQVAPIDVRAEAITSESGGHASGASFVIDRPEDIDAPDGPASAMESEPAMLVRENGGPGQSASISIRGSDPRSTLITLDGVPLNSPFLGGADVGSLGLLTLESVETLRGSQSSIRGSDSGGGTVSATTPDPLDVQGLRAGVTAGSFGTWRLKASGSSRFEHGNQSTGVLVAGGYLHSAGDFSFTDSSGTDRIRAHNGSTGAEALVKMVSEPAADHRIEAMAEGYYSRRDIAGVEQYPSETAWQQDSRALARVAWKGPQPFGVRGETFASAWARMLRFEYSDTSPWLGPAQRTSLTSVGSGASAGVLAAPWNVFAFRFSLEGTFEKGWVSRKSQKDYSPFRGTFAGIAGFVAGRPEDPWQAAAEVRLEYDAGFGFKALPGLGVWYEPHALVRLSANAGWSFRLPTLEELYFDTGFVQGNPDLKPEDGISWDAGIELGRGRWWSVKAAYFENHVFNVVLFAPVTAFIIRADNSGAATMRGIEASGRVRWRWFEAGLAYTWMRTSFSLTGNQLPARPGHTVSGSVAFSGGPFRVSVRPSWQSGFFMDTFESLYEEGRFRLDLRLEVKPHPLLSLSLDLQNVTNKKDAVDFIQQPLPGFAAFGTVRVEM